MELWLVRHGTTVANMEGKLQGTLDYPLSEAGVKEATLLAHRLEKQPFSLFFSSDLLRARQTTHIIASYRKGPSPLFSSLLQNITGVLYRDWPEKRLRSCIRNF